MNCWVALISTGISKQEDGQYEEAIEYFNKALVIARSNESKEEEAKTLELLADIYMSIKKYHEAADYYENVLPIAKETGNKELESKAYFCLGLLKRDQGQPEEAIEYFNKSLVIARSNGSKEKEAFTLKLLADIYVSIKKYHEAADCYEKRLSIAQETGDKELEWKMCIELGVSKQEQGQHQEAIEYFNKALVIARSNGSKEEEKKTLVLLADLYMLIEKYHEAVDGYEKCLAIVQQTRNKTWEWISCIGLGTAYIKLAQYNDAMNYMEQGLDIALETDDPNLISKTYGNLGIVCYYLHEYQNSIEYCNKAINLFKKLGDEEGLGHCYGTLSSSYQSQGKFHVAIKWQEESLRISDKIGNKEGKANSLLTLGNIHKDLNNFQKAGDFYQQSLTIAKETSCKSLQGKCYLSLGNVIRGDYRDFEGAADYYKKALAIAKELDIKETEAKANLSIGNCYKYTGRNQEANQYYNNCLTIAKEINDRETEAVVYFNMANIHFSCGEFQLAIGRSEEGLDIAVSIGSKDREGNACNQLGQIYHSLSRDNIKDHETHVSYMAKSEKYLKKALDCFDYLFSQLHHRDQFKISIFDTFIETYKRLTTVLIETQQTEQALLITDRGRARALDDCLISKNGMSQEEYLSSEPLTYPDVENVLSNDTFTLLHYTLLDDSLVVWVLSKDSITFKEIDKHQFVSALKTVNDIVNSLLTDTAPRACEDMTKDQQLDGVTKSLSRGGASVDEPIQDLQPLEILYNVLVAPVLSHVQHDEIVIVPDGKMYTVPFAALIDPNTGKYLSETKRIRLVPSIQILKVLQECKVHHHSQQGALIVGNPSVGKVMFKGKEETFEDILSSKIEVTCITNLLTKASRTENPNITSLIKQQATKDVVLAKLKENFAIIHIAAHGSSDFGEILLSPISSSNSSGLPEEQDYLLTMQEVQQVGIKAQLVVLSCCHSGRGEIRAEGMIGLTRAFLAAGARAVVASFWAINDYVTLCFMNSFYEYLSQGESASVSLDKAMKDIRKDHSDPMDWAPFFLIGDDVTFKFGQ